MLFDQPVTRVPSLQFLLSKVYSYGVDLLRFLLAQLVSCLNDFYSVKKKEQATRDASNLITKTGKNIINSYYSTFLLSSICEYFFLEVEVNIIQMSLFVQWSWLLH